jgi:response regulator NasT
MTALDPPQPADPTRTLKVLIVEDDTLVGISIRANLEQLGHSVVGQAATEAEAMEMFRQHQPNLVIMDIRLDGADGIELARKLLAERPVPVIIVSAFSDDELINRAVSAGVYGYLIKPATRESLSAQIAVAVGRFTEKQQLATALETR